MANITAFILDFEKYRVEDLKKWLLNKVEASILSNKQKIFSQFVRYFVFEEFFGVVSPIFSSKASGKPYLKCKKYFFNISHTHSKIIIVVADNEIGVDTEIVSKKRDIMRIAERFFSQSEYHSLENSTYVYHDFYTLWSLKEAQVKRSALGIAKGLNSAIFYKNIQNNWVSKSYPNDFFSFYCDDMVISICCDNLNLGDIDLFEIVDFKFVKNNL